MTFYLIPSLIYYNFPYTCISYLGVSCKKVSLKNEFVCKATCHVARKKRLKMKIINEFPKLGEHAEVTADAEDSPFMWEQ